ncbi:MAG TPA: SMI1/KNR4 family protein, partial [Thioploca sp.]|nr:SMI1/KNR4 family protein [Thioploca sp.]
MEHLIKALDQIMAYCISLNLPMIAGFAPGLAEVQIQEITKNLPFRLPRELVFLYQWHNGIDASESFLPYYRFLSLQKAVDVYQRDLETELDNQGLEKPEDLLKRDEEEGLLYHPYRLPIFQLDARHYYIAHCEPKELRRSPILSFFLEEGAEQQYDSLTDMMSSIADCYANDAYYINKEGELEEDKIKVESIDKQYRSVLYRQEQAEEINKAIMLLEFPELEKELLKWYFPNEPEPVIDVIDVIETVADALTDCRDAHAVPYLLSALINRRINSKLRSSVAFVLGQLKVREAIRDLLDTLEDSSWEVRCQSAAALGNILNKGDTQEALEPLLRRLEDEMDVVRWHA